MQLPFTRDQFFDVFAAYNAAAWPGVVTLWAASLVAALLLLSRWHRSDRVISGLLAFHWAWSAIVYHALFFSRINPAAWVFGALFLVQAVLLFWSGAVRGRLRFDQRHGVWRPLAWIFIAYALAYPVINAVQHSSLSRIPAFAVPCPTTIFTAGLLISATPPSWRLAIIPILWSGIGGSAASLLGVSADYALPIAGGALALSVLTSQRLVKS